MADDNDRLRAELKGALAGAEHLRAELKRAEAAIARVRRYAESRCTEEYQDYASASVVLAYLDGEVE